MRAVWQLLRTSFPIDCNFMATLNESIRMDSDDLPPLAIGWRGSSVVLYALMFSAALTGFMAIAGLGSSLIAPPPETAAAAGVKTAHAVGLLPHLLLALVVV